MRQWCSNYSTCGPRQRTGTDTAGRRPQRHRCSFPVALRKPFERISARCAWITCSLAKDTLSGIYTIDDGAAVTATPLDPFSTDIANLREQVLSLEETHVFSPTLVNTARVGYSRAAYYFLGKLTPGTPAASVTSFVSNYPTGAVVVGGSTASNPATQLGLAGSNNGTNLNVFRNLFTYEDQLR